MRGTFQGRRSACWEDNGDCVLCDGKKIVGQEWQPGRRVMSCSQEQSPGQISMRVARIAYFVVIISLCMQGFQQKVSNLVFTTYQRAIEYPERRLNVSSSLRIEPSPADLSVVLLEHHYPMQIFVSCSILSMVRVQHAPSLNHGSRAFRHFHQLSAPSELFEDAVPLS